MLESISIQNFALIDMLRIKIQSGLTVITGETGAGKSTFLKALHLISGGRAHSNLIRTGTDEAKVEATFILKGDEQFRMSLRSLGIRDSKKLTITRVLRRSVSGGSRSRKNTALINGVSVSIATLHKLMTQLIEISGQDDAHHLRQASTHLTLVDQAAGLGQSQQLLSNTYQQLTQLDEALRSAEDTQKGQVEREDFLSFQLNELQDAQLDDPLEDEHLQQRIAQLKHAGKLKQNAFLVDRLLYGQQGAAVELLNQALNTMEQLLEFDDTLRPSYDDLQTALAITEDIAREASSYARGLSDDSSGLAPLEDRLDLLKGLKQKHRCDLSGLLTRRDDIARELQSFESLEERIRALKEQRRVIGQSLLSQAQALSQARQRFAPTLCEAIERELRDLGMPKAKLQVEWIEVTQGSEVDQTLVGPRGLERANLMISANPGEPLLPVQSAASGGEISRITLAIKRVIADLDPVNVYVFDEVDSGVGGPTAEALGLKLKHVSRSRQVLCITHLPQVAGIGDQHLFVSKQVRGERTRSVIKTLTREQRIEEISRMLGGKRITDRTRANAEELLGLAGDTASLSPS